jgi:hypothetical protein
MSVQLRNVPIDRKVGCHHRKERAGLAYGPFVAIRKGFGRNWWFYSTECPDRHEFLADAHAVERAVRDGVKLRCRVCHPLGRNHR